MLTKFNQGFHAGTFLQGPEYPENQTLDREDVSLGCRVSRDESIRMGMLLYTFEDTLLKALSWYRRGNQFSRPRFGISRSLEQP